MNFSSEQRQDVSLNPPTALRGIREEGRREPGFNWRENLVPQIRRGNPALKSGSTNPA